MTKKYVWLLLLVVLISNMLILRKYQLQQRNFANYALHVDNTIEYRDIRVSYSVRFDNTPIKIDEIHDLELCFIVSKLHCNQCVDSITTLIQKFNTSNTEFHFRVLAKYNSIQDLHLFKRLHGIGSSIIPAGELSFPIMETEIPLLFIYDPDNQTAHHIFAPDPHDTELTLKYLRLVCNILFSDNLSIKKNLSSMET